MRDPIEREFLLTFWKVHILHHAAAQGVYGLWMLEELRRHGYRLSPARCTRSSRGWRTRLAQRSRADAFERRARLIASRRSVVTYGAGARRVGGAVGTTRRLRGRDSQTCSGRIPHGNRRRDGGLPHDRHGKPEVRRVDSSSARGYITGFVYVNAKS